MVCFFWNLLTIGVSEAFSIAAALGCVAGGVVCITILTIAALALVVNYKGNLGNAKTCHFILIIFFHIIFSSYCINRALWKVRSCNY